MAIVNNIINSLVQSSGRPPLRNVIGADFSAIYDLTVQENRNQINALLAQLWTEDGQIDLWPQIVWAKDRLATFQIDFKIDEKDIEGSGDHIFPVTQGGSEEIRGVNGPCNIKLLVRVDPLKTGRRRVAMKLIHQGDLTAIDMDNNLTDHQRL
jgi:hypothetical protein